jgi:hypothetical protein
MKTYPKKFLIIFFIIFSLTFSHQTALANSDLTLEWEQHWDTYGSGGTCCYGTHNFFVGDLDNDGTQEMITGGFSYNITNNTRISFQAPLKIWTWNGKDLICESAQSWNGSIRAVYASDIDNDGVTEIITAGTALNQTGSYSQINIWSYDGKNILHKGNYNQTSAYSIYVTKINENQTPYIITAGQKTTQNQSMAQLSIFQWNQNKLNLLDSKEWASSKEAYAYSVYAYDLNNDGTTEIITGGYDNGLLNSTGQLRIWSWTNNQLLLQTNKEWQTIPNVYGATISGLPMGNTMINNIKAADVDHDSIPEIITGGWTYDGTVFNAQLRIWNWNKQTLTLETTQEWISQDITEIKSISINDVDRDNQTEIVTSGLTSVYGSFNNTECNPDHAQIRIWTWNNNQLTLDLSKDWTIGDGVVAWNLATADIDNDQTVELITVGCMGESGLCDPDLRIWSINQQTNSTDNTQTITLLVATSILISIAILIYFKKTKQPPT